MKKINLLSLALLATAGTMFTSCGNDDEAVDPVVVQENDIPNGSLNLVYSVHVIPSSENARVAGLAGAQVTINQGGNIQTKTTDASGIVSFDNLREGDVSVFIKGPDGYLSINADDYVGCQNCDYDQLDTEQIEYNQETYILPKRGATVSGRLFADQDFDGGLPEATETVPAGTTVIYRIDESYQPNVFSTTTDAGGNFSFTNLPEGVNGNLDVNFSLTNSTLTPTQKYDYFVIGVAGITPDVNDPIELGNVSLDY